MKPLTADELVELLPPDEATLDAALRRFDVASPGFCREPGYCKQLIDEGWMTPAQINWNGKPAFIITWHLAPDGGFWLDLAQTLDSGAPFDVLTDSIERIAREKRCRYIRFLTLRRGLVRLTQQRGYRPETVMFTKLL